MLAMSLEDIMVNEVAELRDTGESEGSRGLFDRWARLSNGENRFVTPRVMSRLLDGRLVFTDDDVRRLEHIPYSGRTIFRGLPDNKGAGYILFPVPFGQRVTTSDLYDWFVDDGRVARPAFRVEDDRSHPAWRQVIAPGWHLMTNEATTRDGLVESPLCKCRRATCVELLMAAVVKARLGDKGSADLDVGCEETPVFAVVNGRLVAVYTDWAPTARDLNYYRVIVIEPEFSPDQLDNGLELAYFPHDLDPK